MDFLTKTYRQLMELFQSMTPAAHITAGLLLIAVVASLGYLFYWKGSPGDEFLLGGREFSQAEIATMEGAFAQAGLNGSVIEGNRVRVPSGQKEVYLASLADNKAVPANFASYFDQVFESETGLLGSHELREQKLKNAKEKYVALVVSKMEGIEYATVRFDKEQKAGRWLNRPVDVRAGVAVKPKGSGKLNAERVQAIRGAVASFIAGLEEDGVTVTDLNGPVAHVGGSSGPYGADNDYAAKKIQYEDYFSDKIGQQLQWIPGVVVGVNVELDPQLARRQTTLSIDPKTVPLRTTESRDSSTMTEPKQAGRPGAASNGVGANTPLDLTADAGAKNETTSSTSETVSAVSHDHSTTEFASLVPKGVLVSVAVPRSYYEKLWKRDNPPAEGVEPTPPSKKQIDAIENDVRPRIEETVVKLLPPVAAGEDKYKPVSVTIFDDLPPEPGEQPASLDFIWTWLYSAWPTLAMVAVGLMGLLYLRRMLRPGKTPERLESSPSPSLPLDDVTFEKDAVEPADAEAEPSRRLRRFGKGGPSLRDELTELVKEDPDAAANVLRSWIGDAA